MSIIKKLYNQKLLNVPHQFCLDTHYEVMMGSAAYNVAQSTSDMDVHAICTPPLEYIYPHLSGHIRGFGDDAPNFDTFQQHGIVHNSKDYDVVIYSIIKTFNLAAENNPNILDMLWVPDHCVLQSDAIGQYIRKNRKHFLHRGSYHKFRGYAYAQLKKYEASTTVDAVRQLFANAGVDITPTIKDALACRLHGSFEYSLSDADIINLNGVENTQLNLLHSAVNKLNKREFDMFVKGYDSKGLYHVIRLALQCQQILEEGDMDITRNSELLKSIRRGEWTLTKLKESFNATEKRLDELYTTSKLPYSPDMKFLGDILLCCIEMKYGSLSSFIATTDHVSAIKLDQIRKILES